MKNKPMVNLALTLCLSPLLMQCVAAEKDVKGLDLRLRTMDTKIVDIGHSVETLKNKSSGLADMGQQLDQINTRMLKIEGQVDEATHQRQKKDKEQTSFKEAMNNQLAQLQNIVTEMGTQLTELKGQLALITDNYKKLHEQRAAEAEERAKEAAAAAAEAARAAEEALKKAQTAAEPRSIEPAKVKKKPSGSEAAAEAKPAVKDEPQKTVQSAATLGGYEKGAAAYKAKKYKEAYNALSDYLEKKPNDKNAKDARFMLGESLYHQQEYELAILEYQRVIADFPQSAQASAALFQQGLAFEKLDEKETAKIVYNKLIADYPKSLQVDDAKKRLSYLK
ncbi:MAG: tetratricopeptide repeat protein [Desulfobulbaceae bacterium]|nr:tetratricopeptide repeat protein [Desulfobulbaceae bacterium]HIJ77829.1 tetratricopeptide repeat protein [Deltaproteobacteria bacterium]